MRGRWQRSASGRRTPSSQELRREGGSRRCRCAVGRVADHPQATCHSAAQVNGAQTHGLAVFHAADDRKVMVVQTASNLPQASGLTYPLLLR